jgi:hypothetical protein
MTDLLNVFALMIVALAALVVLRKLIPDRTNRGCGACSSCSKEKVRIIN